MKVSGQSDRALFLFFYQSAGLALLGRSTWMKERKKFLFTFELYDHGRCSRVSVPSNSLEEAERDLSFLYGNRIGMFLDMLCLANSKEM
jgi:hypothetical protein